MKITHMIVLTTLLAAGLACGYSKKATTPAAPGTMPNISALVPNSAASGSKNNTLTINGTHFNGNASVNWNGTALTTQPISANQVMAAIPDGDVASPGTAAVTVTNPGTPGGIYGGGTAAETSNSMTFTIN